MIDILQELHIPNKYFPVDRHVINGEEVVTVLERSNNCKDARGDGDTRISSVKLRTGMQSDFCIRFAKNCYDLFFKVPKVLQLAAFGTCYFWGVIQAISGFITGHNFLTLLLGTCFFLWVFFGRL